MRTGPCLLLVVTLPTAGALLAGDALACNCVPCDDPCPTDGAANKPAGLDLSLPFADGENVLVTAAYGPNGGSAHCGIAETTCSNDHFALDFVLPSYAQGGKGQPVLAAASGTVEHAGWASGGWSTYGQRVFVHYDYDADGHAYWGIYAHMDSITVSEGQHVEKGQQVGTLGQSCNQQLDCGFFNPHLHFANYRDPAFSGDDSYAGASMIPEPIDGYSGLTQGTPLVSHNNGEVEPTCDVVIGQSEVILEEDGACAEVVNGPLTDTSGNDGHAYWTTLDNAAPDYAQGLFWNLPFAEAGSYHLSVFVSDGVDDRASSAEYKIQWASGSENVTLDQASHPGAWVSLGSFNFEATGEEWVRLGDDFVVAGDEGKSIVFDALRIVPSTDCVCTDPDATETRQCDGGTQSRSCDGCSWSDWSSCSSGTGGGGGGGGTCTPGETQQQACAAGGTQERVCTAAGQWGAWSDCGTGGAGGSVAADGDDGCGCRLERGARPGRTAPWGGCWLLGLGLLRRRRRRASLSRGARLT